MQRFRRVLKQNLKKVVPKKKERSFPLPAASQTAENII